jgi:hypothetical protein
MCTFLGIGCATTSWGSLQDGAAGGPRAQIDPQGLVPGPGTHVDPHPLPEGPVQIRGRLQLHNQDILAGGRFFAEAYIASHEELAVDRHDNASWREVIVTLTAIHGVEPCQESVHAGEPAIMAWQYADPLVTIVTLDVPGDGRFLLGHRAANNGDGTWHYEYAVQNLNSTRAAGSFSIPIPAGVEVTDIGFHDVDYHSGDGVGGVTQSGLDWSATLDGAAVTWSTEPFEENANANALRWSTLYNFRFDADQPPAPSPAQAALTLFLPGSPGAVGVAVIAPAAPGTVPAMSVWSAAALAAVLCAAGAAILKRSGQEQRTV